MSTICANPENVFVSIASIEECIERAHRYAADDMRFDMNEVRDCEEFDTNAAIRFALSYFKMELEINLHQVAIR